MIILTPSQAIDLRAITENSPAKLDPRLIQAGQCSGQYAIPARALHDPELTYVRGFLEQFGVIDEIDTAQAFPASEE